MAQAAQDRVQTAIRGFVNNVDRTALRGMERQMHLCAADCCSQKDANIDEVHECVERCQASTMNAQKLVQSELERFQEALSRCVLSCQDDIKDKVTPSTPDSDVAKYKAEFDTCAISCCDKNVARLPTLSKKVLEMLKSGKLS
jgi:hypothetical protein